MEAMTGQKEQEIDGLITWAEALMRYMGIAINFQSEKLAEIAIDKKDMDTFGEIIEILKSIKEGKGDNGSKV